jgi:hypothetical protein
MRLISDTVSASDVVEIPITFMVNLRRFIDTTTDLNRNGCVESELYLKLDKNSKIADLSIRSSIWPTCDSAMTSLSTLVLVIVLGGSSFTFRRTYLDCT